VTDCRQSLDGEQAVAVASRTQASPFIAQAVTTTATITFNFYLLANFSTNMPVLAEIPGRFFRLSINLVFDTLFGFAEECFDDSRLVLRVFLAVFLHIGLQ